MLLPTIKIVDGDDYRVINAADFDPARHVRYGAEEPKGRRPMKGRKAVTEADDGADG